MSEDSSYSKHLFYTNIKKEKTRLPPRELAVFAIAILLVIMPWAWGGVVWWATLLPSGFLWVHLYYL